MSNSSISTDNDEIFIFDIDLPLKDRQSALVWEQIYKKRSQSYASNIMDYDESKDSPDKIFEFWDKVFADRQDMVIDGKRVGDPRGTDFWLGRTVACPSFAFTAYFEEKLGVAGEGNFYYMPAGTSLPAHRDQKSICALNVIIGDCTDPVRYDETGNEYSYKTALLDTVKIHSVPKLKKDRLIYKFSVIDRSFEEMKEIIKQKLLG